MSAGSAKRNLIVQQGLEGFLIIALAALAVGGFCVESFLFHLLSGRSDFATRTLPWARGAWTR